MTSTITRLSISASLWSADLSCLADDIQRVDPFVDRYHIDVSDGTYAEMLLFFPDLVAAARRCTSRPFDVHLIVRRPERWLDAFVDAGATRVIFYPDSCAEPQAFMRRARDRNIQIGVSLAIEHRVELIEPWLTDLDGVTVMGTAFDIKGVNDIAPETCQKIQKLCELRAQKSIEFDISADGAIRRHTVPRLREAGADEVVAGSLIFAGDPSATSQWVRTL